LPDILLRAVNLSILATRLVRNVTIPAMKEPETISDAERYSRLRIRWSLIYHLAEIGFLLVLTLFARYIATEWLPGASPEKAWGIVVVFYLVAAVAYAAMMTAVTYHAKFTIRRQFGLASQASGTAFLDSSWASVLRLSLSVPSIVLIILPWGFDQNMGHYLSIAGIIFVIMLLLIGQKFQYRRILGMPAKRMSVDELPVEVAVFVKEHAPSNLQLFLLDSVSKGQEMFAAFSGSRNKPKIFIGNSMASLFIHREMRSVVAHELGHWKGNHAERTLMAFGGCFGVSCVMAILVFHRIVGSQTSLPEIVLIMPVAFLIIAVVCFLLRPIQMALSRYQERRANAFALETTNDPAAFVSAMKKLAANNLSAGKPPWWLRAFYETHPTLEEVIQQAEEYAKSQNLPLPGTINGL
jgi:Zn-dependent protease with chaperone function